MAMKTRFTKKQIARAVHNWYGASQLASLYANKDALGTPINALDPITMEPLGKCVFLHTGASGVTHGYDARTLFDYIEASRTRLSPLTRERFTDAELSRLSVQCGRDAQYLAGTLRFAAQAAECLATCIDNLWFYMELLVALGEDAHMADFTMIHMLIWPWLLHESARLRAMTPKRHAGVVSVMCLRATDIANERLREEVCQFCAALINGCDADVLGRHGHADAGGHDHAVLG